MQLHRRPCFVRSAAMLLSGLVLASLVGLQSGCAGRTDADSQAARPSYTFTSRQAAADYLYLVYLDLAREGDMQGALAAITEVAALAPNPEVYSEAARMNWRLSRLAAAEDVLANGLAKFPGNRLLVQRMAETRFQQNDYDGAAAILGEYLAEHPDDADFRVKQANVFIEAERFPEALEALRPLEGDEVSAEVLYLRGRAASRLNENRRAIRLLQEATRKDPEFLLGWVELAYVYERMKDYVAAEETYEKVLQMEPGRGGRDILLRLVELNIKLNDPERALKLIRMGSGDSDGDSGGDSGGEFGGDSTVDTALRLEGARLLLDAGFHNQAMQLLSPMAEQPNPDPAVWFFMALAAYEGQQDAEQAIAYLERYPDTGPHIVNALSFKTNLLFDLGRLQEARTTVSTALKRFPDERQLYVVKSWILEDMGELDGARDVLLEGLARFPEDTDLLYRLGVVHEKAGRSEEAIEVMERIISLDPQHADALNFVGYMLAEQGRDLDRALVLVRTALQIKPGEGYILDSLAWVQFKRGQLDEAWESINQAVAVMDADPNLWEHYGDIATARGQLDEARTGYDRALKLLPPESDMAVSIRVKREQLETSGQ